MRVLVVLFLLAGCAARTVDTSPLRAGEIRSARAASQGLTPGKSTKADVRAALGQGTVIDFASGYEVWVYREPSKEKNPGAELVLLFEPSGTLTKARTR